jgi:hypothetical protein
MRQQRGETSFRECRLIFGDFFPSRSVLREISSLGPKVKGTKHVLGNRKDARPEVWPFQEAYPELSIGRAVQLLDERKDLGGTFRRHAVPLG